MSEKINITDYTYGLDSKVEIGGTLLLAILNFTAEIIHNESKNVLLFEVPEIKEGEIDFVIASKFDFFQQKEQKAVTVTGAKAMDIQYLLEATHYENIVNGVALKNEDVIADVPKQFEL
jgi:hypothetical protein